MIERRDDRGRYAVLAVGGDAVWFHFEGVVDEADWPPSEALLERVLDEHGSVLMLGNGELWKNYHSGYRQGCTAWFVRRRERIRGVHLLVQSKILKMGVEVVNLVVPIIEAYGDIALFNEHATALVPMLAQRLARAGLELPGAKRA